MHFRSGKWSAARNVRTGVVAYGVSRQKLYELLAKNLAKWLPKPTEIGEKSPAVWPLSSNDYVQIR
jgi:predicted DNA-binding transcriptional regulator AlpA